MLKAGLLKRYIEHEWRRESGEERGDRETPFGRGGGKREGGERGGDHG